MFPMIVIRAGILGNQTGPPTASIYLVIMSEIAHFVKTMFPANMEPSSRFSALTGGKNQMNSNRLSPLERF